jgi:hypothetical protein
MLAIGEVPKRGHNTYQDFRYIQEGDMFSAIRTALAGEGVIVLSSVDDVDRSGGAVLVKMTITLTDGEETYATTWFGENKQGVYSAYTGALKTWCQKTFLVADGTNQENTAIDSDSFDQREDPAPPKAVEKIQKKNGAQSHVWALIGAIDLDKGEIAKAAKRYIKQRYDAWDTASMSQSELEEFGAFLSDMSPRERLDWCRGLL